MTRYSFTVPGKPQPKQRPRVVSRGGFARAYTPKQTKDYEALVKECFLSAYPKHEPTEAAVKMEVIIGVCPPKSSSKKKQRELLESGLPTRKPDADNVFKAVADSLNGVLYVDDSQLVDISIKKVYSESDYITVNAEIAV